MPIRPIARAGVVAALLAVAPIVAAPLAFAIEPPSKADRQAHRLYAQGAKKNWKRHPACRPTVPNVWDATTTDPAPAATTELVGLLRRPAAAEDALPQLAPGTLVFGRVHLAAIRSVVLGSGERIWMMPTQLTLWVDPPTERCRNLEAAQVRRLARAAPARVQRKVERILREVRQDDARARATKPMLDGLAIGALRTPQTTFAVGQGDIEELADRGIFGSVGASLETVVGVVPDGVASIDIVSTNGARTTAAVKDNVVSFPGALPGVAGYGFAQTWRGPGGEVLKEIPARRLPKL
ncbi:MAG: hypothetical protein JHC95_07845 [Solirubrobacteraceae bacterium]|nr:hypothetical protein [Solirubrobacteraceae bacterium]